ncbi:MAG: hypothetical protein KA149_09755 [Chitinophagales bacterium]|nr:hypothetical protein [Chitinophagales bacterium]
MKFYKLLTLLIICCFALYACNHQPKVSAEQPKPARIVIHFELDSAGNLTDAAAKKQLEELAVKISRNADRVMMYSYTEKLDSVGKDIELAKIRAAAAKALMYAAARERIYYGVGIDARGFENPVDAANPYSVVNRRIEIEYLP